MKILGTGLSGLVGSRISELLKDKYQIEKISKDEDFEIQDRKSVINKISSSDAPIILHLVAKTDVDGCEKDKDRGIEGEVWKTNVEGTRNVVDACVKNKKKIIYFSTDFVFDGKKKEPYDENDKPNPVNWYAQTKYEGEKIVQSSNAPFLIIRLAYPFRGNFKKRDYVRLIIDKLENNKNLQMVTDHIMTPTFIDDLPIALDTLIKNNATGIFHTVGSSFTKPYNAAVSIAQIFNLDKSLISKISREEYFKDKAPRPFNLALKNDKIRRLGIKMKSFEEGLLEFKKQVNI